MAGRMMNFRHSPLGVPWAMDVIWLLTEHDDAMRFNDIMEAIPGMPRTGLSWVISNLMQAGWLDREAYQTSPLRFDYSLSLDGYVVGNSLQNIKYRLDKVPA